ncbi:ANTAR domain-containing protein (plasmid) [Mycolicibacterium psychrotolerans]|uniref:ANTAR domain-containing protein n=1 Tax=Mycolicibacterium psychrotolerans TaxID=216929 RepID=UPI003D67B591
MATQGFYIDITEAFDDDLQRTVTDRVQSFAANREVINLAKGMLMAIYRITPDAAFEILKWRSQELNVKLIAVAERLVSELPVVLNMPSPTSTAVDHYLMTLRFDD